MAQIILQPVTDKLISVQNRWNAPGRGNGVIGEYLLAEPVCAAKNSAWIEPGFNPDHSGYRPQDQKIFLPFVQP